MQHVIGFVHVTSVSWKRMVKFSQDLKDLQMPRVGARKPELEERLDWEPTIAFDDGNIRRFYPYLVSQ